MRVLTLEEVDLVSGGKHNREAKILAKIEKLEDALDELDPASKRAAKIGKKILKLEAKLDDDDNNG